MSFRLAKIYLVTTRPTKITEVIRLVGAAHAVTVAGYLSIPLS